MNCAATGMAALASAAAIATLTLAVATALVLPAAAGGAPLAVHTTAGSGFTAVLLADGSVWLAAGPEEAPVRRLTRVPLLQGIVQVAAEGRHLYARQSDGRVWSWEPGAPAMPRPVQGLPGKAIALAVGANGRLVVLTRRSELPGQAGSAAAQQIELRLEGPVALAQAAQPLRYVSNDSR